MTNSVYSKDYISTVSDAELLGMINGGSKTALTELYDRYWEPIFLYVIRVLKDVDGTSDVVQETFIALWQKQGSLCEVHSLKAYLFGIARYKALRCITLNASEELYRTSLLNFFNDYQNSAEVNLIASEMETFLEAHIQSLPDRMREVFLLSRRDQLSYAEIAQRLNISDKTVKKQISNALKYLRSVLDEKHMWTTILLFTTIAE